MTSLALRYLAIPLSGMIFISLSRYQKHILESGEHHQQTLVKLDVHLQKNEIKSKFHKTNPKWIKELNVRLEPLKLLEGNLDSALELKENNRNKTPFSQELRCKLGKWNFRKVKSSEQLKEQYIEEEVTE